jgi:hypothetical protein
MAALELLIGINQNSKEFDGPELSGIYIARASEDYVDQNFRRLQAAQSAEDFFRKGTPPCPTVAVEQCAGNPAVLGKSP